jgi:hypothetical protein
MGGKQMSDTPNYVEYRPPADGVAPPYWREGMKWTDISGARVFDTEGFPKWKTGKIYYVEPKALTAPNEDVVPDGWSVSGALSIIRAMSPDELAKHGITLAPEMDWATELWADLMDAWNYKSWAQGIRDGFIVDADQAAIALIRERVVLKEMV